MGARRCVPMTLRLPARPHERAVAAPGDSSREPPVPPIVTDNPPTRRTPAWQFLLACALLLVHAVLIWLGRDGGVLTGADDATYLLLGRALQSGRYVELWMPVPLGHHMYPPGYPALLGVWTLVAGGSFGALIALQVLLSTGTLAMSYDVVRRLGAPILALLSLAALAVNPSLVELAGRVMSEPAFAFCMVAVIWAMLALKPGPLQDVLLVGFAVAAPMMRAAGFVVPVAVVLALLLQRRYRLAALLTVLTVVIVGGWAAWMLRDPRQVTGQSYVADLGARVEGAAPFWLELLRRVRYNVPFYLTQGIPFVLGTPTVPGTIVDNLIGVAVLTVGLGAGLIAAARRLPVAALDRPRRIVAAGGLALADPAIRCPAAADAGADRARRPGRGHEIGDTSTLDAIIGERLRARGCRHHRADPWRRGKDGPGRRMAAGCERGQSLPPAGCTTPDQRGFFQVVRYLRDSLPPTERVAVTKAPTLSYYLGRPVVAVRRLAYPAESSFVSVLREAQADVVLLSYVEQSESTTLLPRLEAECTQFEVLTEYPTRAMLLRPHTDPVAPAANACGALARYRATLPPPEEAARHP